MNARAQTQADLGFVEQRLAHYKELTIAQLLRYVPDKEPRRYLWDLVTAYPRRAGKGLRPGLCLATCRAFGGEIAAGLHCAVGLELFHNAFLVHDDVEDDSEHRRGEPTLHAAHGLPIAVNVGDAMNVLSLRPLMENLRLLGPSVTLQVFDEIEHMVRESVEGQALELGWVRDNAVALSERDYLRMTLKKTCWYTCIHPCRLGALVATGGGVDLDTFNEFGFFMGAAFQIQDDLLNLLGDEGRYGKEIGGDIAEGKRTLMLIHAYDHAAQDARERLHAFLASPRCERSDADIAWVHALMERTGAFERARICARELAQAAAERFELAYGELPESPDKRMIRELVGYMIERDL
ncbi:MAG TPA: polyprenyl synthetase family protein [Solirubrobacteraceae bacterium]|nr:polyprenyl synthetase family protein [Solirubrobacteraceae bacterium]